MRAFVVTYFLVCFLSTVLATIPGVPLPDDLRARLPFVALGIPGFVLGDAIISPFDTELPEVIDHSSKEMDEYWDEREKFGETFRIASLIASVIVAWPLFPAFRKRLWEEGLILRRVAVSYTLLHALMVVVALVYLFRNMAAILD